MKRYNPLFEAKDNNDITISIPINDQKALKQVKAVLDSLNIPFKDETETRNEWVILATVDTNQLQKLRDKNWGKSNIIIKE